MPSRCIAQPLATTQKGNRQEQVTRGVQLRGCAVGGSTCPKGGEGGADGYRTSVLSGPAHRLRPPPAHLTQLQSIAKQGIWEVNKAMR